LFKYTSYPQKREIAQKEKKKNMVRIWKTKGVSHMLTTTNKQQDYLIFIFKKRTCIIPIQSTFMGNRLNITPVKPIRPVMQSGMKFIPSIRHRGSYPGTFVI
jgi:hypothetical protein